MSAMAMVLVGFMGGLMAMAIVNLYKWVLEIWKS